MNIWILIAPCMVLAAFLLWSGFGDVAEAAGKNPKVRLSTNMGDIVLELYADKAPGTVANFLKYVDEGYYTDTVFHRVIDGFMIQGGGMIKDLSSKPGNPPIKNEADNGLKNLVLTVAMARTPDPHSASSQFFINLSDNEFLNHTAKDMNGWGYAVFGKVVEGQDVVEKIGKVATGNRGAYSDVPQKSVVIEKAEEIKE